MRKILVALLISLLFICCVACKKDDFDYESVDTSSDTIASLETESDKAENTPDDDWTGIY